MKHIVENFDESIVASALWDFYFKDLQVGVFDIETTGLDRDRNKFVLGGLYNCSTKKLHQILAQSRKEEKAALEECAQELAQVDMVVTYNGRHFDMPFVERRWEKAGCGGQELVMPYNLDLYLVLNGHSPIKKLVPNMKQKTIENYMGFWDTRSDEISGAESVELFNHYEATGDPKAEEKILLHNNDDVRQLTRITQAIKKSDFHKAMFHLGFPVGPFTVQKIRLQRDFLQVSGVQRLPLGESQQNGWQTGRIDYIGFTYHDQPVDSRFESRDGWFEIRIPIIRQQGLAIADLQCFGLQDPSQTAEETKDSGLEDPFGIYPRCESGFIVLGDGDGVSHMETNHFVKSFLRQFAREELNIYI